MSSTFPPGQASAYSVRQVRKENDGIVIVGLAGGAYDWFVRPLHFARDA